MSKVKQPRVDIVAPDAIFLEFVSQQDNWYVVIPNAFGPGVDFKQAVSERVHIQFQPASLNFPDNERIKIMGVMCIPLVDAKKGSIDYVKGE